MPDFEADIEARVTVSVEVYCGKCGAGLCGETTVGGHRYPQLHVQCGRCQDNYEDEIAELRKEIEELENNQT